MIDWYNLLANALWIFALALALFVLSFARWEAAQQGEKAGAVLNRPNWQIWLNVAGMLFSLGLAATAQKAWEWGVWLVMAALFGVQIGLLLWSKRISSSWEERSEE